MHSEQKCTFGDEKLHFISYGDDTFKRARERIYKEALETRWFYSTKTYSKDALSPEFRKEFENILSMRRGGGYWIWKFDVILRRLREINEGEFLIYLDAGCSINVGGGERLKEYIAMIRENKSKIISFQMSHLEKIWTTNQIFESFGVADDDEIKSSGQFVAGLLIMQKCDGVVNLFEDCYEKLRSNPLLITDHYNKNQDICFKDNRHDQSMLSVARKIHGSVVIQDETWSTNFNSEFMCKIPFLATRRRI
jgi:hypothetical protein